MSHISDLEPCGLLFTLVTPSYKCVCVYVCAVWWHVRVVSLPRANQTHFKKPIGLVFQQ